MTRIKAFLCQSIFQPHVGKHLLSASLPQKVSTTYGASFESLPFQFAFLWRNHLTYHPVIQSEKIQNHNMFSIGLRASCVPPCNPYSHSPAQISIVRTFYSTNEKGGIKCKQLDSWRHQLPYPSKKKIKPKDITRNWLQLRIINLYHRRIPLPHNSSVCCPHKILMPSRDNLHPFAL